MGFSLKKAVGAVSTGGLSLAGGGGGLSDLLFGRKAGGVSRSPLAAQAEALQKQTFDIQKTGLTAIQKQFGDVGGFVRREQGQALKQAQASAADQQRALQTRISQRGLGESSVGLGAQSGIDLALAQQKGAIGRSGAGLRQQAVSGLLGQASGVGRGLNVPIAFRNIAARRQGGISGALGAGIGGAFGGPQGAQIGASIGGALGR